MFMASFINHIQSVSLVMTSCDSNTFPYLYPLCSADRPCVDSHESLKTHLRCKQRTSIAFMWRYYQSATYSSLSVLPLCILSWANSTNLYTSHECPCAKYVNFWLRNGWMNKEEHLFILISKSLLSQFANTLSQNCDIWA